MELLRIASLPFGVFGVLKDEHGVPFAVTGERPWLNNKPFMSCIPVGDYLCKLVDSPHFGKVYEILTVPGRDKVLFHKGNIPLIDSEGCILIGEEFGYVNGKEAVLASGRGFGEFMAKLNGAEAFNLQIRWAEGGKND